MRGQCPVRCTAKALMTRMYPIHSGVNVWFCIGRNQGNRDQARTHERRRNPRPAQPHEGKVMPERGFPSEVEKFMNLTRKGKSTAAMNNERMPNIHQEKEFGAVGCGNGGNAK